MPDADRIILALTLWGEARGEAVEGRIAVASVIHNRLIDGRWGSSYAVVCQKPWQFSCWNANDPNRVKLAALQAEIERGDFIEPIIGECLWIAEGLIAGKILPRVQKATHYFASSIQPPTWTQGATFVDTIGHHSFYQGVK